jgi:hypothetical protein
MYLFKKMDETLISWIDNDTDSNSFHSPDSITSQKLISPKLINPKLTSPIYIEIKEENIPKRPSYCTDKGEICFSESEEETQQPNFLIKETDITYIDFNQKEENCCCCIIL